MIFISMKIARVGLHNGMKRRSKVACTYLKIGYILDCLKGAKGAIIKVFTKAEKTFLCYLNVGKVLKRTLELLFGVVFLNIYIFSNLLLSLFIRSSVCSNPLLLSDACLSFHIELTHLVIHNLPYTISIGIQIIVIYLYDYFFLPYLILYK